MAIYVDKPSFHGWKMRGCAIATSRLFADSDAELHAFAKAMRLVRRGFCEDGLPHYVLDECAHGRAVHAGALQVASPQARHRARHRPSAKDLHA